MPKSRQPKGTSKGGQFSPNSKPAQADTSPLSLPDSSTPKVPAFHKKLRDRLVNELVSIPRHAQIEENYWEKYDAQQEAWEQGNRRKEDGHIDKWEDSIDCFLWFRDARDRNHPDYVQAGHPDGTIRGLEGYCCDHLDGGPKEQIIREVLTDHGLTITKTGPAKRENLIHPIGSEPNSTEYGPDNRYAPVITAVIASLQTEEEAERERA